MVPCCALRAPAYVNIDYGSKASAFDRIQVDALVRIATAAATMVKIGSTRLCNFRREKKDHVNCGVAFFAHQYSSANMIVSTRVTTGSPFALLTSGSSYIDLEKDRSPLGFEGAKVVFFVWVVGGDKSHRRRISFERCVRLLAGRVWRHRVFITARPPSKC